MEPFIGEIRLVGFNFPPVGWAFCNGAILPISEYDALFALIGTTYGGDGENTFALPDLRGRVPLGQGSNYVIGQQAGTEVVSLISSNMPNHSHVVMGNTASGTQPNAAGNYLAKAPLALGYTYDGGTSGQFDQTTVAGQSAPHNNMQPSLAMNYIISLFGVFPSRP